MSTQGDEPGAATPAARHRDTPRPAEAPDSPAAHRTARPGDAADPADAVDSEGREPAETVRAEQPVAPVHSEAAPADRAVDGRSDTAHTPNSPQADDGSASPVAARSAEAPLAGCTVAVTAARRAEELAGKLERRGAQVVRAPAVRLVPLADDTVLREATAQLLAEPPDLVFATTGVGLRGWLAAADEWGTGDALREVLAGAELLARGPKATGALRGAGLREAWSPASESSAEVLSALLKRELHGVRIAVQLHGDPLHEFVAALRAAGADVVPVPVYRWLPPADLGPLDALLDAVVAGTVDAVTFTSALAASALLQRAGETGRGEVVEEALRERVGLYCVGPVTAEPLNARGLPTRWPERYRTAALVRLVAEDLPEHVHRSPLSDAGEGSRE